MRASLLASAWAVSWVPMLSHTASSPFPGSPQEGPTTLSPQLTQRVLQKTRLRRSELADQIHVLLTPFNNHYFTLLRKNPCLSANNRLQVIDLQPIVCKEPILGPTAGGRRSQSAWTVDILIDGEKGGDKDIATPRWRLVALL